MAFTKTMIPLRSRDSFFRDEYFSDCWDIMERQKKEFEQKCATKESLSSANKLLSSFDRRPEDELLQYTPGFRRNRYHPASLMIMDSDRLARKYSSGLGIHSDRDNFKVSLDVQQFAPEELTVKTIDSTIIIEGKHEEKEEGRSLISRHFQRKYTIPPDVKAEEVQCSFTADGRLHISAPRHQPALTSINETSSKNNSSEYEKMKASTLSSEMRQSSISDKFREEIKQVKEDFDKSTAELLTSRQERKDAFREEIKKAQEEFDKSTSSLLSRERGDRDDFRHSRLLRMFEPHFTAFPEFDPLPFWKRGKTSTLLEEFDKKSSLFDEFASSGRLGKTSLIDNNISSSQELQDRENFKVMLDVHEFKPEELSVKTYDYYVEIEAKHEAKEDPYGFIKREFKRKYTLPRDVKASDVQCNLSSEGILVVTAPRQKLEELAKNPQSVPIQQKETTRHEEMSSTRIQSSLNESRQDQTGSSSHRIPHEHTIPMDTSSREKSSTVHQILTEKKEIPLTNGNHHHHAEHNIEIGKETTKPHVDLNRATANGERLIHIDQESQSQTGGVRVEFPESRPESSASSIPFDFSRGKSEEPISVASSVQPTFETLGAAPGERIIKIQVAN